MPFGFEGQRRRLQAENALNQLAVLANALVTFDNGRMGELVLPKQGVHEAFSAADRMISDSITAVARLVLRPGLINVGLDELMSALKTNRSRCLFGSGLAKGENRAQSALKKALDSPLARFGVPTQEASTVLVHICGGEDLTMFEVELLMEQLTKHIPKDCHLLFGAATDPETGQRLERDRHFGLARRSSAGGGGAAPGGEGGGEAKGGPTEERAGTQGKSKRKPSPRKKRRRSPSNCRKEDEDEVSAESLSRRK